MQSTDNNEQVVEQQSLVKTTKAVTIISSHSYSLPKLCANNLDQYNLSPTYQALRTLRPLAKYKRPPAFKPG